MRRFKFQTTGENTISNKSKHEQQQQQQRQASIINNTPVDEIHPDEVDKFSDERTELKANLLSHTNTLLTHTKDTSTLSTSSSSSSSPPSRYKGRLLFSSLLSSANEHQQQVTTTSMGNNNANNTAMAGDKNNKTKKVKKSHMLNGDDIETNEENNNHNNQASTNISKPANGTSLASRSFCSRFKCIILLMGFIFIFATILLAIISFHLLNDDNQCFDQNSPFQQADFYLYSTKTMYSTAFNYLTPSSVSLAMPTLTSIAETLPGAVAFAVAKLNHHQPATTTTTVISDDKLNHQDISQQSATAIKFDKSSIHKPKFFSPQDSLESLNKHLVSSEMGCRARHLYYVGRHAARLPSKDLIDKIHRNIESVKSRIDLSKYLQTSQPLPMGNINPNQQQEPSQQALVQENGSTDALKEQQQQQQHQNKSKIVCFDPLVQFKQWTRFAVPEQGNLIMETGGQETLAIAQRFKRIYPHLFNASETKIEFGTTKELRTAQTAVKFLLQIDNYKLNFCDVSQFPKENAVDEYRAQEIRNDQCLRGFLDQFSKEKLYFHETCRKYHEEKIPLDYGFNLKNRTDFIAQAVSKRLKLISKEDRLNANETKSLYDACRYESALMGVPSIWCSLFSKDELQFYEYLNDIDDYFNQAYGDINQALSSCPLTNDLLKLFKVSRGKYSQQEKFQDEAHFYFTHSEVIQRLLAASVDLQNDYSGHTTHKYLDERSPPADRQWQTSLLTPFSSNLAFTLYECPKVDSARTSRLAAAARTSTSGNDLLSSQNGFEFDVTQNTGLKVVASLNEHPIMLDGCSDYVCDLNTLIENGRIFREKKCNLKDLCKKYVVIT